MLYYLCLKKGDDYLITPQAPVGKVEVAKPIVPTGKIKKVDDMLKSKRERPQEEIDIIKMLRRNCHVTRSFSELDFECMGEYKLQRLDEEKPTKDGVYGVMGGICHDINEGLTKGEIKQTDAKGIFEGKFNKAQMLGMSFPSDAIRNKYKTDLNHYYDNFKIPEYVNNPNIEVITELFVWDVFIRRNKWIGMYGYSDLVLIEKADKGKVIHIIDYKTSNVTDYRLKADGTTSKKRIGKGRQLLLYKEMIYSTLIRNGILNSDEKVEFRLSWEMLKFVEYKLPKDKTKELNRLKATELKRIADVFIKGYNQKGKKKADVIEDIIEGNLLKNNDICKAIEGAFAYSKINLKDEWLITERYQVAERVIKHFAKFIDNNGLKIYEFSKTGNLSDLPEEMNGMVEYRPHYISYDGETADLVEKDKDKIEHTKTINLKANLYQWIFERNNKIEEYKVKKYYPDIIDTEKLEIPFYCQHLCGQEGNCNSMKVVKEKLEKNRKQMTEGM